MCYTITLWLLLLTTANAGRSWLYAFVIIDSLFATGGCLFHFLSDFQIPSWNAIKYYDFLMGTWIYAVFWNCHNFFSSPWYCLQNVILWSTLGSQTFIRTTHLSCLFHYYLIILDSWLRFYNHTLGISFVLFFFFFLHVWSWILCCLPPFPKSSFSLNHHQPHPSLWCLQIYFCYGLFYPFQSMNTQWHSSLKLAEYFVPSIFNLFFHVMNS